MSATAIVPASQAEQAPKKQVVIEMSSKAKLGFFTRMFLKMPGIGKVTRGMSRRDFESRLARYVNSALGHESEGLAAGADEYKRLYGMATKDIAEYCEQWNVNRLDLEAQIPAIRKLRNLANPSASAPKVKPGQVIGGLIAVVIVLWLAGAATGMFQVGHQFILHHFGR